MILTVVLIVIVVLEIANAVLESTTLTIVYK